MSIRKRLLGFAFASADLLLELGPDYEVVMAMGSGPTAAVGPDRFQGSALADRIGKASIAALTKALSALAPGTRIGPVEILMTCGEGTVRRASLYAFAMPELAPNVSCSISYEGPVFQLNAVGPPVIMPETFLARTRERLDGQTPTDLAVAFVDVIGLSALGAAGDKATSRVEAALQSASIDGASAAHLGQDRYALLRDQADVRDIVGEVRELIRDEGMAVEVGGVDIVLSREAPLNAFRALRFAIEACLNDGGTTRPDQAFNTALDKTVRDAQSFATVVKQRSFALHYQPIVDLRTGVVHHVEALARFVGQPSPAATIHMAEELALVEGFDLAVAEKAIQRLRRPGSGLLKIAINVSGGSLNGDTYVASLLRMTAAIPQDRHRLIVEVTESTALADVAAANRRLSVLREAGIKVCIDDFGTGAASFDYLRSLSVDTVKIDGKFVRDLERDLKSRTMIAHLIELCGSLHLTTIAEFIETEATADLLRQLGVDYGQGWLFGKAEAEPRTVLTTSPIVRRIGAVDGWG